MDEYIDGFYMFMFMNVDKVANVFWFDRCEIIKSLQLK